MIAGKLLVVMLCAIIALQSASTCRFVRSPDKMEVDVPNHSLERESGEYQENMQEEAVYWHGQGDKLDEKENEGHEHFDEDREKNQENYDHEKDYYQDQQQNYNKEMNQTYQEDRNKTEAHHQNNQEHYDQHHIDNNYQTDHANKTAEELTQTDTADRYGEKGTEHKNEGEDKVQNYEMNGDSPSFTYTRN